MLGRWLRHNGEFHSDSLGCRFAGTSQRFLRTLEQHGRLADVQYSEPDTESPRVVASPVLARIEPTESSDLGIQYRLAYQYPFIPPGSIILRRHVRTFLDPDVPAYTGLPSGVLDGQLFLMEELFRAPNGDEVPSSGIDPATTDYVVEAVNMHPLTDAVVADLPYAEALIIQMDRFQPE